MSSDNFDNEISKLYQQRKAQIIAPHIAIKAPFKYSKLSPISVLGIFAAASIASFGIMAIISQLSNDPIEKTPMYRTTHPVEIIEIAQVETTEEAIVIPQPLPPKPAIKIPSKAGLISTERQVTDSVIEPKVLAITQVQLITLPQIKEPVLVITPIYKVLPQYTLNSLKNKPLGAIQLRYKITPEGTVNNITVVKSSVSRKIQKSAKKALAKWQYTPSNSFKESYEIIFEFKADKS